MGLAASPAAALGLTAFLGTEMGLLASPGADEGLGAAPVTEGGLPWGVRLLLLLKKEALLGRLFRLCSPAEAPGLDTAPYNQGVSFLSLTLLCCNRLKL